MLKISNTLSGKVEEFQPLDPQQVRIYTCGPTVYDHAHIGNFRTFVFQDVLKRYLRFKGYAIFHVMNITDVDDKTIRNSGASTLAQLREYTSRYSAAFFEDCDKLRILRPDVVAHATEHIPEMAALIQTLAAKGYTYQKEGSTYFKIAQFKDYGKLSKLDAEGIMAGARVDVDEYGKQDARDFVLWKAAKNGEPHWETALGPGRPGWHVECSAMSMKYLGESFDLHCGAVDLVFPHHENEIAQSEAATEKPFVRYWMHGEHLIVDGEKMAKSKGNFYTLRDLEEKGFDPLAVRYALQSVPYRRQLNFTFDLLHQSGKSLARLQDFKLRLTTEKLRPGSGPKAGEATAAALQQFEKAMDDDLNTAQALAAVFDWVRDLNTELSEGRLCENDRQAALRALEQFNQVLELWKPAIHVKAGGGSIKLSGSASVEFLSEVDEQIRNLIEQRSQARSARNFALADQLRDRIYELGYIIEDTKEGIRWKKR
ncbi:MAG: cysteine--tRNA ligase [Acidimicrobiia bacterium]|nr:cysteine--tRNA ligase [Acidimicrobiia bacterium]